MKYGTWVLGLVNGFFIASVTVLAQVEECETPTSTASDETPCTGSCPQKKGCDCPTVRDYYDVGEGSTNPQSISIPVIIHLFGEPPDEGTMDAQVSKLEDDFIAYGIDLDVEWEPRDNTAFEYMNSRSEIASMKTAYNEDTDTKINLYVTSVSHLYFRGTANWPWMSDPLGPQNGATVDRYAVGANKTTMTHELGHVLGLWHTHHGTVIANNELGDHGTCFGEEPCDCQCYETADGADCDITGDFCCDTDSTPPNTTCVEPVEEYEECGDEDEWAPTDYWNFMGYAADGGTPPCRNEFSPQQTQRMHCYVCNYMSSWIVGDTGGCCYDGTTCKDNQKEACCENTGGKYAGDGTDCETGACCDKHGNCTETTEACCRSAGKEFNAGSDCETTYCPPIRGPSGP